MWETWVQSLGWEEALEEGEAIHSSILAWRIPMDRGAWRAIVHGVAELDMTKQLTLPLLRPIKYHFIKYHYHSQLKEKKLRIRRVM